MGGGRQYSGELAKVDPYSTPPSSLMYEEYNPVRESYPNTAEGYERLYSQYAAAAAAAAAQREQGLLLQSVSAWGKGRERGSLILA